jgi:hypothetical protein
MPACDPGWGRKMPDRGLIEMVCRLDCNTIDTRESLSFYPGFGYSLFFYSYEMRFYLTS